MHDNLDHARGWFLKADSDLYTAKRMLTGDGLYDTACFHAFTVGSRGGAVT